MSMAGLEQANFQKEKEVVYQPFEVDFSGNEFANGTLHGLQKLYRDEVLTDFTLKLAEEMTLKCHKSVLYLHCDFFSTMFTSEFSDSNSSDIDLEYLDADCVEAIIEFCYFGTLSVAWNKIELFVEAVIYFGIDQLWEACDKFIALKLTPENATHWYSLALIQDLPTVRYFLETELLGSIWNSDDFRNLPVKNVKEILENEFIYANEDAVLQACAGWWLHGDNRSKDPDLCVFSQVRYKFCTKPCIADIGSMLVAEKIPIELVKKRIPLFGEIIVNSTDKDLTTATMKYVHDEDDSVEKVTSSSIVYQELHIPVEVDASELIASESGTELKEMTTTYEVCDIPRAHYNVASRLVLAHYDDASLWLHNTDDKWTKLTTIPNGGSQVVTPKHACGILVTGGSSSDKYAPHEVQSSISHKCKVYDSVRHEWYDGPKMISGRSGHTCVYLNGKVYTLGGDKMYYYTDKDGNEGQLEYGKDIEVLCLDLYNMNWTVMAPMLGYIDSISTVTNESFIYMFGNGLGSELVFHKFETDKNQWVILKPPPVKCYGATLLHRDGKLFMAHKEKDTIFVHKYDIETNTWEKSISEVSCKSDRSGRGGLHILYDKLLFCLVDKDDDYEERRRCFAFDIEQLKWVPFSLALPSKDFVEEFDFSRMFNITLGDCLPDKDEDKLT